MIIFSLRMPRIAMAIGVGAALAVAGFGVPGLVEKPVGRSLRARRFRRRGARISIIAIIFASVFIQRFVHQAAVRICGSGDRHPDCLPPGET